MRARARDDQEDPAQLGVFAHNERQLVYCMYILCANELLNAFQGHGLRALDRQAESSAPDKRDGSHCSGHAENDRVAVVRGSQHDACSELLCFAHYSNWVRP